MSIENNRSKKISNIFINTFFVLMSFSFIIPFFVIISASLSNDMDIVRYGYSLIPRKIDLTAYNYILKDPSLILSSYKVTSITSLISVAVYLAIASMCAYSLSRMNFRYRGTITFYLFFTMLFNGGLVPTYILMTRYLHLKDTYLALIIPLLGNVWFIFLMRTFFQQLPEAIVESATIDGAGDFLIYMKLILPLSKPVLATVGLMQLLAGWNSWFPALLYISDQNLYPLQYLLQVMLLNIQEILNNMQNNMAISDPSLVKIPPESVRMAMCILAVGPMVAVFPFFQKYFTKGLTVGSIKG